MAPICDTVTVEDLSSSSLGISSITASGGVNEAQANVVLKNTIEGGSGESLTKTLSLTVDGSEEHSEEVSLEAGEEVEMSITLEGLSSGTYDVCASIGDSESCKTVTVEQEAPDQGGDGSDGSGEDPSGGDGDGGSDGQDGQEGEGEEGSGIGGLTLGAAGLGIAGYLASKSGDDNR